VGTFLTIATSVVETEAHIASAQSWFWRRVVEIWTDIHTLPETNSLRGNTACIRKFRRFHRSLLYQVVDVLKNIKIETLKTINPFILAPWEERLQTEIRKTLELQTEASGTMLIVVSSSAWNEVVGFGGVI
jgi:hypothetical protein